MPNKDAEIRDAERFLRPGKPMPVCPPMAVSEHSHLGESQSNGKVDKSIRTFVEHFACLKASVEARLELTQPIPCSHPLIERLVEHTAFLLNKFQLDKHGETPHGDLNGKESRDRMAEFGETVLWHVTRNRGPNWIAH